MHKDCHDEPCVKIQAEGKAATMNTHSVPSLLLYKQESLPRNTHEAPDDSLGP